MGLGESSDILKKQRADKLYLSISLFVFLILILIKPAQAQQTSTTTVAPIKIEDDFKRTKIELIGYYNTNLYESSASAKESSTQLWILPDLNFKNGSKLSLFTILSRDISEQHKTKFSPTRVEYTFEPIETRRFIIKMAPSILLPTDPDEYETNTLRGAISLTLPAQIKTPLKKLTLIYSPRVSKNIHEFNTNANNEPNLEYLVRHRAVIGYDFTDKVNLKLVNDFVHGWTYRGTPHETFAMAQSLTYAINKNLYLELGHSNKGSTKKEGGAGSNVVILNEHTSEISFGIGSVF